MSWSLGLETSSSQTNLCLRSSAGACHEKLIAQSDSHTESLSLNVDALIAEAGIKPSDVAHVVVAGGPGSFTGLRIGFSFAKGLALSLKCPLSSVSSLAAAAAEFSSEFPLLCSFRDARRDEVFWEVFSASDSVVTSIEPAVILPLAQIPERRAALAARFSIGTEKVALVSSDDFREQGLSVRKPSHGALQLLRLSEIEENKQKSSFSLSRLLELQPTYLRAVAAKTIAERAILPG
ncbi:MAG: tRNA (adenosine(37)-N6)-threonylcarbamoyltransferase complex dimerization subunit type 1 TsaB [Deltaproteobacteria bacterium]|nr:tRNA (adenosine(37)-N6)-threonylcarbamoyltransferase complex dimerization subunit type 1 TsaB [Deltaproteobacteria bacterium]